MSKADLTKLLHFNSIAKISWIQPPSFIDLMHSKISWILKESYAHKNKNKLHFMTLIFTRHGYVLIHMVTPNILIDQNNYWFEYFSQHNLIILPSYKYQDLRKATDKFATGLFLHIPSSTLSLKKSFSECLFKSVQSNSDLSRWLPILALLLFFSFLNRKSY